MDVERTIEFLLEHAARNQAEIAALKDRISDLGTHIDRVITVQERQADLLSHVIDAQARTDARLDRVTDKLDRLTERMDRFAERQEQTDYEIRALIDTVNRMLPRPPNNGA